jgi:glycosyltransferase involved in cell wall biosynthesis
VRVVLASTYVPFLKGGGTTIVHSLERALRERGHEVEPVLFPFWPDPEQMVEQMLALRLLDVSDQGDILIAVRTPSYLLRHPDARVWFLHHHRPAYDLAETEFGGPQTPEYRRAYEAVVEADNVHLREAGQVYALSHVVAGRLRRYNDLDVPVLYAPLPDPEGYRCESFGDYVFFPSRITPLKRQWLAVEAMAHVKSDIRLVVAGPPDLPAHVDGLRETIEREGLEDRVELIDEWIDDERKRELIANALAVVFTSYDEDYGYVTLEALHSQKPVLTCKDSGAVLELVEDGVNGLVVPPDPQRLAEAIDRLAADRPLAEQLGSAGRDRIHRLGIDWETVVESLTG